VSKTVYCKQSKIRIWTETLFVINYLLHTTSIYQATCLLNINNTNNTSYYTSYKESCEFEQLNVAYNRGLRDVLLRKDDVVLTLLLVYSRKVPYALQTYSYLIL